MHNFSRPFNIESLMVTDEIQADLEAIERNVVLYEEASFDSRVEALDYLEFHILDRIEGLLQAPNSATGLLSLQQRAENVKRRLGAIDAVLFQRLRADIRTDRFRGTSLLALVTSCIGRGANGKQAQQEVGYDTLDVFTNNLFPDLAFPSETQEREPEMVFYQKTPARVIFELVEKAQFTTTDVLYDLGSGLGHVPILVNLLSGVTAKGIEVEPAYCAYASACAADLNLPLVTFIQTDARTADYSDGTVFFLYTPFEGRMLQEVLERLRTEAQHRSIRLFTYGPCTLHLAQQGWLRCVDPTAMDLYKLAEFRSFH
ncbi:hypothetical protein [Hymenobacter sp. GOD-10R]|uniref:hypothetical protein n=1 Tax=Hymenobacter sp. GOD-10R TaxID=3093922 RepID=UPI002D7A28B4|nr:hypothetical protein [Hymenobacter sp. GOD-10R]WRQ27688.1 hypothetical protein SD425_21695 [Hymenobacter sp. GOD-10R]